GGGAAAAAYNVDKAILCPLFDEMCGLPGLFVVFTHGIGQAGVGVGGGIAGGDLAQLFYMTTHFLGAEGTVKTDAQWAGMHDGNIEGFQCLSAEGASAGVGDGSADHYGQLLLFGIPKIFFDGEYSGLGVQGVEDGLDKECVDASFHHCLDLL